MGNSVKSRIPECSDSNFKVSGEGQDKANPTRSINFGKVSSWNFSSLSGRLNLSFSGRARSHNCTLTLDRDKKKNRVNSSCQYRKTTWPTPHTDSYFLSHFKRLAKNEEFILEDVIAEGAFGTVYRVAAKRNSKNTYALKELKKSKIIEDNSVQQLKDEVEIQKLCGHHPFIVKQFDSWQTRRSLYILLEYIPHGELFTKISTFSYELIRVYIAEIGLAIDFLHNAGVIYRDVKPENILLSSTYHIKITDFGLSKWLKFGERTRTMCGTFQYMVFDLACEGRQVDEAVSSIFHTVLFHRCQGKFEYGEGDESYTMGAIGFTDVDCNFIDFTYVCVTSDSLRQTVKSAVSLFSEKLRSEESTGTGQISLEFFQKKKRSALLGTIECVPWEVWTVKIELVNYDNEDDRQMSREMVGEMLSEKIIYIAEVMNRYDYVPRPPPKSELDWVYNTQIPEVQPYLFKIDHSTSSAIIPSVGSAVKKIIRETLSL